MHALLVGLQAVTLCSDHRRSTRSCGAPLCAHTSGLREGVEACALWFASRPGDRRHLWAPGCCPLGDYWKRASWRSRPGQRRAGCPHQVELPGELPQSQGAHPGQPPPPAGGPRRPGCPRWPPESPGMATGPQPGRRLWQRPASAPSSRCLRPPCTGGALVVGMLAMIAAVAFLLEHVSQAHVRLHSRHRSGHCSGSEAAQRSQSPAACGRGGLSWAGGGHAGAPAEASPEAPALDACVLGPWEARRPSMPACRDTGSSSAPLLMECSESLSIKPPGLGPRLDSRLRERMVPGLRQIC